MKIFETIYNKACAARLKEAKVENVANAIAKFTKSSIAMGEIDTEALQRLNKLIQNTIMSDFGIEGDKSVKGVNKAINYVFSILQKNGAVVFLASLNHSLLEIRLT